MSNRVWCRAGGDEIDDLEVGMGDHAHFSPIIQLLGICAVLLCKVDSRTDLDAEENFE